MSAKRRMMLAAVGGVALGSATVGGAGTAGGDPAATTERISVASDGAEADFPSWGAGVSGHGRVVVFTSDATNLVPGDVNGDPDVFVRDRFGSTTEMVSVDSSGSQGGAESGAPAISHDGRFVAFETNNDFSGDANREADVYVRDRRTATTELVSLDAAGAQSTRASRAPSISDSGRFVAFTAWDLAKPHENDDPTVRDVYVRDRRDGITERISRATSGLPGKGHSYDAAISGDGRFVAFTSEATNLVPGGTSDPDVYVHDRRTGETEIASVLGDGSVSGMESAAPSLSRDGRFVAFHSNAALTDGDANGEADVFVRDRRHGITHLVSIASDGTQAGAGSFGASISADGNRVAFWSLGSELVPEDSNGAADVFLHDRRTGTTRLVSAASADGSAGNAASRAPSVGARGRVVAFESAATDLVADDRNGVTDVFAWAGHAAIARGSATGHAGAPSAPGS